jgi:enoyl-CoA hydratase/carnithine racemase
VEESIETAAVSDLEVELDDRVGVLTMRRMPACDFDMALIKCLADTLDELAESGECRAVVLRSAGKQFSTGANFQVDGAILHAERPAFPLPEGLDLYDEAVRIFKQPLPVVAAVNGAAIGGGMGLALAADFRVASSKSWFSANFARLGLHHGFGISASLLSVVGFQRATDMLYLGRRVYGEEAFRWGLCDRLVPEDRVHSAAMELAAEIASAAPLAVRAIRQTMRLGLAERVEVAISHEREEQLRLLETSDWSEGIAAAAERRPPNFLGS